MASHLTAAQIRKIRAHVKRGGVIAYPTESCYGLGCDPSNARAVKRLLRIKGRPQSKGLILIGSDFSQLRRFAAPLNERQWRKIAPTWPGPVTWALPAHRLTPPWLRGRHGSIALRVSAHPVATRLCQVLGMALVSTSANRSGRRAMRSYGECLKAFHGRALVVPGLIGSNRNPSTIVDFLTGRVIRA
jgi:L-threonylcarbamoyladenylate synthase